MRYCQQCGGDTQGELPATRSLPAAVGKAALPIAAGALSLVARAGWKLLQHRLSQIQSAQIEATPQQKSAPDIAVSNAQKPPAPQGKPRATIHVRSSWAVGDASGQWKRGSSEQTIEIHD